MQKLLVCLQHIEQHCCCLAFHAVSAAQLATALFCVYLSTLHLAHVQLKEICLHLPVGVAIPPGEVSPGGGNLRCCVADGQRPQS